MSDYIDTTKAILIIRRLGGIGDIFMTRPIMKAIKAKNPSINLHYALPSQLIPLVSDCEAIDAIMPFEELNETSMEEYRWCGDITRACIEHEIRFRSRVHIQRTNLWAKHLGIEVNDHNERFRFTEEEMQQAEAAILEKVPLPENMFFVSPYSADPKRHLTEKQARAGIDWARGKGMNPVILHGSEIPEFDDIPQIFGLPLRVWMAVATKAKMALTTDTGAMHLYGYLKIPTAAMFCFTSGQVVPRHYPTVIPFQLHRDNKELGMPCTPCYDWGSCPYLKKDGNPVLKCVRDIPDHLVIQALEKAFVLEETHNHHDVVQFIDDKVQYPSMNMIQSSSKPLALSTKPEVPKKLSVPTYLEINMSKATEVDAMIACGVATAVKSRYPKTSIAVTGVHAGIAEVLQLCPFVTIDNSGTDNPNTTKIDIQSISNFKHGWIAAMTSLIGVPTDGSAGLANCSTNVRTSMFEEYGEKSFELRYVQGDPELDVPDKVWVQPSWKWEEKIACAKLSRKVFTDNEPMAFACASLGIPVVYQGPPSLALKGMKVLS